MWHPWSCFKIQKACSIRCEWKNDLTTKQNECIPLVVVSRGGVFSEAASGKGGKK